MANVVSYPTSKQEKETRRKFRLGNREITRFGTRPFYNRWAINSTDAFKPEQWAQEAVRVLTEEMIFGSTVHRDFDPTIARYGEIVHTRRINELSGKRKQNDLDDLESQDIVATNIPVSLNQRVYTSFLVGDGERSKSFQDLIQIYLIPAMRGPSRFLDRVLGGQVYQFLSNPAGGLGTLTKSNAHDYLINARGVMNTNKVGPEGRWMALASPSETTMQQAELFKSAEQRGDGGRALREALLGRIAGFNNFLELNTPSVSGASKNTTTTVNGAKAKGSTTIVLATGGVSAASIETGLYITIAGDNQALRVLTVSTDTITVNRPLMADVASGAVVTCYTKALVNQASAIATGQTHAAASDGYPANWLKAIVHDGSGVPQIGQLISFKTSGGTVLTKEYCVVDYNATTFEIMLDQPLEAAIDNNAIICLGPNGDFNFGYQRDALTLVNRPLALPVTGAGARSANAMFENIALRVTITYDGVKEAHRVTCTGLFGVAILDSSRGCVLLG